MRNMLIPGLLGVLTLTGCATGALETDNDCEDCPSSDDEWILLVAEDRDQGATLTIEFLERESQVGQIGWHLTLDCPDVVELYETPDELQNMLDDRGYNVDVENVDCVRWNVNYADGRFLCEGNDNTPYAPDLLAYTKLNWLGNKWYVDTWSDPGGEGCSAVACR